MSRRLHVSMGNYEWIESGATFEVDTIADAEALAEELGPYRVSSDVIFAFMRGQLEDMLASDIEDARMHTDEDDSFIHPYAAQRTTERKRK